MYDYKDKYSPQKIGDKIIIPTERYEKYFLVGIIFAVSYDLVLFLFL